MAVREMRAMAGKTKKVSHRIQVGSKAEVRMMHAMVLDIEQL
jgi:hypothetical protein